MYIFVWEISLYFSIGNGQPREPALCQLYQHFRLGQYTTRNADASSNLLLLARIAECFGRGGLFLCVSGVPRRSVCLYVSHDGKPCKNGWTDRDAVFGADFVSPRKKGECSPYSIAERRVPELIPVLGSQPAGDVSHKPGGRQPLLSAGARPAVTHATLNRAATNFAAWWTEARWVWTVCPRQLPDSVAAAIWTQTLLRLSPAR